jgi:hypothetical protein
MIARGLSKPATKAGRLQRAALGVLNAKHDDGVLPTNGRFVYYELEHTGLVRKSKPGESRRLRGFPAGAQDLGDAVFYLRDKGIVPWSWITDETRTLHSWRRAASVADYGAESVALARIDLWRGAAPLLLVESRSLGGVLHDLAGRYLVDIAATNGQVGGFLRTDIAPALTDNKRPVLYLGDHDHQGDQIETNTRRVLERETGRPLDWRRLALTGEQVDAHALEPIWKKDERYRPALEHWAYETEALGQRIVMELVRTALDELLPEPIARVLEREDEERQQALRDLRRRPR